jgi:sugar phosphate isomerase/epimerase
MQRPFWKNKKKVSLIKDLINIVKACSNLKIKYIIYPLVDNSSLKKADQKNFIYQLKKIMPILKRYKVKILFESDYSPLNLKKFIKKFDKNYFGINYDSGNSSGLGYNIDKEFQMYGKYIQNVHIKDRALKGNTVRLGAGNANFTKLFSNLKKINYKNLLILQTARSHVNNHVDEIKINLNFLKNFQINY